MSEETGPDHLNPGYCGGDAGWDSDDKTVLRLVRTARLKCLVVGPVTRVSVVLRWGFGCCAVTKTIS